MNFRMQWQIQNPSIMMQQRTMRSIFDVFSRIYDDEKEFKRYKGIYTLFLAGGLELW